MKGRGHALESEYFHKKEKEVIAKMKAKIEEDDAKRLGIKCPKCDGKLIEADFEEIKIDVCDKCSGVWLDAGELTLIVDHEKDGGWFGEMFN